MKTTRNVLRQVNSELLQRLALLDLSPVINQLLQQGWTEDKLALAVLEYKQFLLQVALNPTQSLNPSPEADLIWHQHLLVDSYQYAQDCDWLLGYFLHHRINAAKQLSESGTCLTLPQTRLGACTPLPQLNLGSLIKLNVSSLINRAPSLKQQH